MTMPDVAALWARYGRHAAKLFRHGPQPRFLEGPHHFVAFSGAPHVDLNQAALFGEAGEEDAAAIIAAAPASGPPLLLGLSSTVTADLAGQLGDAGFVRLGPDALYWAASIPPLIDSPFRLHRVEDAAARATMIELVAEADEYDRSLVASMLEPAVQDRGVTGWLARDGEDAVSFAVVTEGDAELGLWLVVTLPRHRRRGAGSALVRHALGQCAKVAGLSATVFWSSPAGRPLYESLGFTAVDSVDVWALGASEADLAAVGVVPPGA